MVPLSASSRGYHRRTMAFVSTIEELGDRARFIAASNLEQCFRFLLPGTTAVIAPGYLCLVTGEPHPFGNFGLVSDATDIECTRLAAAPLAQCNAPALMGFHHDPTPEIVEHLSTCGFGDPEPMPVMAVDIDQLVPTGLPDGYEFRVAERADAEAWTKAVVETFGLPKSIAEMLSPHRAPRNNEVEQAHFFGVFHGDRVVATSGIYLNGNVAGIYSVGTVPEARGKGLGAHVSAESLRFAAKMGYKVGVLQSSTAGYSVYKRLGFQDLGTVPLFFRRL
jgi:GNAT superfamily N-acetyltransferase